MATKQKNIFTRSKPLMNIYSGVDHEGKEVEVREDAEQLVKWHEISDALVAAGYYRAQLQGLSAFDKIVGGLTWCIELCDIDVDISLLFEENLTIGKKIALTEKIVKVLPSMKCPHTIEPHQIQGLDFINIYPLILWLIKYSSEFREAKEDELRKFAVMQYDKSHIFESDRAVFVQKEKLLRNLAVVQNLYKPCRVRKRKGGLPANELEQVNATLSEYDQRMLMHVSANKADVKNDDGLDFLYDYEKTLADPTEITTEANRYVKDQESKGTDADTKIHYAVLHSELTGEVSKELEEREKQKYSEDVDRLTKSIDVLEKEIQTFKETHQGRMENTKKQYSNVLGKMQKITNKLMKTDGFSDKDVKHFYKSLKELARERNELLQVIQHRNKEHSKLQDKLQAAKDPDAKIEDKPLSPAELKEFNEREEKLKAYITSMRLELAKLNREVLRYSTAIDEVPGTAELLQYEKRFIELYNQVASKHKETKQYYIFYNTLLEVKLYTSKELSLLNSILDNYEEAMSSVRKREEFMSQFESIVDWVNHTVRKVEEKFKNEKERKNDLYNEYSRLMDVQRQYAAALKKLGEQRQRIDTDRLS
ncbi:coiled-coil domain-containing protein 93 [Spodoptera frugiperda]|uniref:Coiled-coil domain-containing protein 93 n=1 Tax=Spodoptera frugiperda TaxID=7108 RepID=A0A9R0DLK2_SPOFR|nr:coiled-coil domain-containing protein 93 [Spodoptera frugiperda]